jgi:hypothetical protein
VAEFFPCLCYVFGSWDLCCPLFMFEQAPLLSSGHCPMVAFGQPRCSGLNNRSSQEIRQW